MRARTPAEILTHIPLFAGFTDFTPTIPKFYWDTYSQEERIKAICAAIDKVVHYAEAIGIELNLAEDEIEKLYQKFQEFEDQGFAAVYEQILKEWINENMPDIIRQAIKMVFFGLTSDGYFCAYIPESWRDIIFDTGMIYGTQAYGRLILQYDVDGTGVLPNGSVTVDEMILDAIADYEEAIINDEY